MDFLPYRGGESAVKPPGDEDGFAFRNPVRKVAAIEGHGSSSSALSGTGIPACAVLVGEFQAGEF